MTEMRMLDFWMIVLTLLFFGIAIAYTTACHKLK